jgi:hypothetical protein
MRVGLLIYVYVTGAKALVEGASLRFAGGSVGLQALEKRPVRRRASAPGFQLAP